MIFLSAFLMGLVGSLHCGVMCGPLVLALPVANPNARARSALVYNAGRITTYALLGCIFGIVGKSLVLVGLQQWLSIAAGAAMLAALWFGFSGLKTPLWRCSIWIKSLFRTFLGKRSYFAVFLLGATNGLLPCGLVYMAGTASAATGGPLAGGLYMVVFGVGTLPVMLGVMISRGALAGLTHKLALRSFAPIAVSLVACALILRGLALGIPYLSPSADHRTLHCPACPR